MAPVFYLFLLISGCGFLLSVSAHLLALAGVSIPGGQWAVGLHVGIFVVWLPAVLLVTRIAKGVPQKEMWKVALLGCPVWMRRAFYLIFGYAILNFALFIAEGKSLPKETSEQMPPEVVCGFSGHWMVFYAAAFGIFYSSIRQPRLYRGLKCSNGHAVSPIARFCPECGEPLESL